MPTFLVLKNGAVASTIRGADPAALRTAITAASRAAASAPAKASAAFTSTGRTLGGSGAAPRSAAGAAGAGINLGNVALDASAQLRSLAAGVLSVADGVGLGGVVRFVGLYLWTLFSLDVEKAAETSPFAVNKAGGARAR